MNFSDLKEKLSTKVKNVDLSDLQRNWLSVVGVVVIIGSFSAITIYGPSNSNLRSQIDSDASQIAKLNASDKGKSKPKAKVEVQAELPNIYKNAMQSANDVVNAQNALSKMANNNNGNYKPKSTDYQAAYYTLSQNIAGDAHFNATKETWAANKDSIMRAYPGSYDGNNSYKLLFTVAPKNNAQNVLYYFTGEYHVDDNKIHDLHYYSTNAAFDPKNGALPSGDGVAANSQSKAAQKGQRQNLSKPVTASSSNQQ